MPCLFEAAVSHHMSGLCVRTIVICFSGEEKMLYHNPCCRWIHLYMCIDTPKDATQYPLCVRASSLTVISGMLVYDSHVVFLDLLTTSNTM